VRAGGRTSAFGRFNRPITDLRREIKRALGASRQRKRRADESAEGYYPIKSLRNRLITAMSLDVATQPAATVVRHEVPNTLRRGMHAQQTVVWNPIWDLAPAGAFYKSRRVCSLVTDVIMHGQRANIARDLERLSIVIWSLSKKDFDGMCRRIRAKIARSAETEMFRKSPEALMRIEALIRNPYKVRVNRCSRRRRCQHNAGYAAMRLSTDVGLVRESLKCTKCTF